ncbi:intermembrane lipid transfer protein VPS13B-like [Salvelinus sp. IW2-2015]|uniref:intermembrane lipid transfer protein VPS13B-like n=1 Tax=Salvelinus sp. IW2-2015 TaxID=2691554 RepID=UPI000CEAF07F|nr:vacuolar protein sorting-associated protein 13B-like [Salvelinus alpinus]
MLRPLVRALPGRVSHLGTDTAAPLPPPGAARHSAVTSTPPFLPDRKLPQEQEYLVIGAQEPRVFFASGAVVSWRQLSPALQEIQFSTELDCRLLEYRNFDLAPPACSRSYCRARRGSHGCSNNVLLDGKRLHRPGLHSTISQNTVHSLGYSRTDWQQVRLLLDTESV